MHHAHQHTTQNNQYNRADEALLWPQDTQKICNTLGPAEELCRVIFLPEMPQGPKLVRHART